MSVAVNGVVFIECDQAGPVVGRFGMHDLADGVSLQVNGVENPWWVGLASYGVSQIVTGTEFTDSWTGRPPISDGAVGVVSEGDDIGFIDGIGGRSHDRVIIICAADGLPRAV